MGGDGGRLGARIRRLLMGRYLLSWTRSSVSPQAT